MLTICIPTRNRQKYLIPSILKMLKIQDAAFKIVIADNSDDKEEIYRLLGAENLLIDKRLKVLEALKTPLSMRENWNRAAEVVDTEWVSFIGDDDYLDPYVSNLLSRITATDKSVGYLRWNRTTYNWPDNRKIATSSRVSLGRELKVLNKERTKSRLMNFEVKNDGFSPYHAAVRMQEFRKLKASRGNVYFTHPQLDWFTGWELIEFVEKGLVSERPFSIAGACAQSNSAAVRNYNLRKISIENNIIEKNSTYVENYGSVLFSMIIFNSYLEFAREYNIDVNKIESYENLNKMFIEDLKSIDNIEAAIFACNETQEFSNKYLNGFKFESLGLDESFKIQKSSMGDSYFGYYNGDLLLKDTSFNNKNPADLFEALENILCSWKYVGYEMKELTIRY